MTEQEWLQSIDPRPMLEFLRGKASDRKLRLFAVACSRRIWHLLTDDRNRWAIEVVERYADGLVPKKTLKAARRRTFQVRPERPNIIGQDHQWRPEFAEGATDALTLGPHESAQETAYHVAIALAYGGTQGRERDERFRASHNAERLFQARLVRCVVGSPFRPVSANPSWLTWHGGLLVSMARQMYDSRDFTDMPVLADALEDAGCTNPEILGHCRSGGEHVRGCWVIDALLGKS